MTEILRIGIYRITFGEELMHLYLLTEQLQMELRRSDSLEINYASEIPLRRTS